MESDPAAGNIAAQLLLLVFLTMVNAFFAGAEMAVVSVNKNKIRKLAGEGNQKAVLIQRLTEDSTSFLSTIQVAITFAGFFSSASAATGISQMLADKMSQVGIPYSQTIAVVVVTIILSYFTLVFGELVPKRVALQKAESFSLFCVKPVYMVSKVMGPYIKLLSVSTNGFLKLVGMNRDRLEEEVSEEEIKSMLETGQQTGVFNEIEKEMITSIFSFDDKRAKEVMVPRQDMVAIDLSGTKEEYLDIIVHSMQSRIPVYEDEIDNIIGVISLKDFIREARKTSFEEVDIRAIMQEPYLVPENRQTDMLFKQMQKEKKHLAILIDEYGGVSGLVTLEDLIEQIVGEIHDEHEEVVPEFVQLGPDEYEVAGSMLLYDLNEALHLKIDSHCDTLSGYLIDKLQHIPQEKDLPIVIQDGTVCYTVLELEDRVIVKVLMEFHKQE